MVGSVRNFTANLPCFSANALSMKESMSDYNQSENSGGFAAEMEDRMHQNKPVLSEVINFERDIAPYPLTMIYAGVGSGKSTFAELLMKGNEEKGIPAKVVLLITSRKAKVVETLRKRVDYLNDKIGNYPSAECICFDHYSRGLQIYTNKLPNGTVVQVNVVCTNAYIESYLRHVYDPNNDTTYPWNLFDVIIWDEVHSLIADSTYQSAPFHVMRLIEEAYDRIVNTPAGEQSPRCKNIICMTGTPAPFEGTNIFAHAHTIDKRAECRSVQPANIHFIDMVQVQRLIREQLQDGERILYFSNRIYGIEKLSERYGCPPEKIVMSFSDPKKLKALEKKYKNDPHEENEYSRLIKVQDYLNRHSSIRPDISLFVTTAKNKEGININDTDIRHVYIESHSMIDIVQMAGRIRCGAEHVYIITDAAGVNTYEKGLENTLARRMCDPKFISKDGIAFMNLAFEKECEKHQLFGLMGNRHCALRADNAAHVGILKYIDAVTGKFPYLQYDHLSNMFYYNRYRSIGKNFTQKEMNQFDLAVKDHTMLEKLFKIYFPETSIHKFHSRLDEAREYIEEYILKNEKGYFTQEEKLEIIARVYELIHDLVESKRSYSKTKSTILYYLGYGFKRISNDIHSENYDKYVIRERNQNDSAA